MSRAPPSHGRGPLEARHEPAALVLNPAPHPPSIRLSVHTVCQVRGELWWARQMDRLRILIVSPELPSRRAGSQVRLLGLVSSLAGAHSVSLLSLETPGGNPKEINAARAY